jgi:hypothetical protein
MVNALSHFNGHHRITKSLVRAPGGVIKGGGTGIVTQIIVMNPGSEGVLQLTDYDGTPIQPFTTGLLAGSALTPAVLGKGNLRNFNLVFQNGLIANITSGSDIVVEIFCA